MQLDVRKETNCIRREVTVVGGIQSAKMEMEMRTWVRREVRVVEWVR